MHWDKLNRYIWFQGQTTKKKCQALGKRIVYTSLLWRGKVRCVWLNARQKTWRVKVKGKKGFGCLTWWGKEDTAGDVPKKKKKRSYKICRQALYVQDISGVFERMRLLQPLPVHPAAIMGEDMQATGATLRNLLLSEEHFTDREVNVSQYTGLCVSFRILHFTQTRVCTGATDIHSHFIHLIINSFSVRLG